MNFDYGYNYRYSSPGYSGGERFLSVFLSIYLIILAVVIIFAVVKYIFQSIGLYTIGKRLGKAYAWLAFVPFARNYFHGELAGEIALKNKTIKNPGIWKLVLPIIYSVVSGAFAAVIIVLVMICVTAMGLSSGGYGSPAAAISISGVISLYLLLITVAVIYSGVFMALNVLVDTAIFGRFTAHNMAIVHSVLSSIIPLYEAFCLFAMRNREFYGQPLQGEPEVKMQETDNDNEDTPE